MGHNLSKSGLVALPLALHRQTQLRFTSWVYAQFDAIGHAQPEDVHVPAGPGAHPFGEEGDPDTHVFAASALFGLLTTKFVVTGHLHRHPHRLLVLPGVVLPARWRGVGELLGAQQILQSKFGRVHLQFLR